MTNSAINLAGILAPAQYRNKIINGNFDIWQRGITFGTHDDSLVYGPIAGGSGGTGSNRLANIANPDTIKNNPYVSPIAQRGGGQADGDTIKDQPYTADRWRIMNRSGWKGHVIRKEFDWSDVDDLLPSGASPARYYMEHSVEVEGNNSSMSQRIEDVTIFNNEKITVSFYARSVDRADSNVNAIRAHLMAYTKCNGSKIDDGGWSDSPDGSPLWEVPSNYQLYNDNSGELQVLSENWQKYTYTFTIPQMAGKTDGNGNPVTPGEGFWIINLKPMSSSGDPWLGAVHYAQVQVEKRDDTTEFEVLPPGIELQRCQRYFQKSMELDFEPGAIARKNIGDGGAGTTLGYYNDAVSDDAVEWYTTGSNFLKDDYYHWESPGCRGINWHGLGMGGNHDIICEMRDVPEVFIFDPITGARGCLRDTVKNDQIETLGGEKRIIHHIRGISSSGWAHMGTTSGSHSQTDSHCVEGFYYWTADAEL